MPGNYGKLGLSFCAEAAEGQSYRVTPEYRTGLLNNRRRQQDSGREQTNSVSGTDGYNIVRAYL
ncbi:hypothetical protein [Photobacterium salinisoli]|uniref:hypothetical protein n=1 Tax=Photobacterium salinisoli TaxID=1616783 RepID=UPI0013C48838|nr:hypothetical protein [Photobacterium salinisoli]